MPMTDVLVAELDHEMATTRPLIERAPLDHLEWKPHPRSPSLAMHICAPASWGASVANRSQLDVAPAGIGGYQLAAVRPAAEMLKMFDDIT